MLFGNQEFITSLLGSIVSQGKLDTLGQCSVQVYQGSVPTDSNSILFDPSTRTSDLLGTFTNLRFAVVGNAIAVMALPSPTTAVKTGTAAWGFVRGVGNVGLIVEAGVAGGSGGLILNSVNWVLGTQYSMVDSGVSITFFQ